MVADRPYICEFSKNAYGKIMLRGAKRPAMFRRYRGDMASENTYF